MVKVNAPAMSLDASGSLGGALVFSKWKGRNYVRTLVKPANPKSGLQVGMRSMFKFLAQQWASVSSADQATWNDKADAIVASPFNAYMQDNQKLWRNFLSPSMQYPAVTTGGVDTLANETATAGTRQISLSFDTGAVQLNNWGVMIFRGLATGFTISPASCIAVVAAASNVTGITYVDTPLDPDQYFYNFHAFDELGALGALETEVNATVV